MLRFVLLVLASITLAGCFKSERPLVDDSRLIKPLDGQFVALTDRGLAELRQDGSSYVRTVNGAEQRFAFFDIGIDIGDPDFARFLGVQAPFAGGYAYMVAVIAFGGETMVLQLYAPNVDQALLDRSGVAVEIDEYNHAAFDSEADLIAALKASVENDAFTPENGYTLHPWAERPRLLAEFEARKTTAAETCDALAASPSDPAKTTPGVEIAEIDATRAVPACTDAVRYFPETPRFAYQEGRAHQAEGKMSDAAAAYQSAADNGYGFAWLNLAWLAQSGHLPPERLGRYLAAAGKAGFDPAEYGFGQDFDAARFADPGLFAAIFTGDTDGYSRLDHGLYLWAFAEMFVNADDSAAACRALVGTRARNVLSAMSVGDMVGTFVGALEELHGQPSPSRDGALVDGAQSGIQTTMSLVQAEMFGKRDARRFFADYGCTSPEARRFFYNFNAFAAR
ncbi:MAG: hypothetical protein AAF748_14280 [Pseudomonadota bacterium]